MKHFEKLYKLTVLQHRLRTERSIETQLYQSIYDVENLLQCTQTIHTVVLNIKKSV